MLLHFALVLHFAAILITFCGVTAMASNKRPLHTAICSAREGKSITGDNREVLLLLELSEVDIFSLLVPTESVVVFGCNLVITHELRFGKKCGLT